MIPSHATVRTKTLNRSQGDDNDLYTELPVCGVVGLEDAQFLAGLHEAGDQEVAGEGEHVPRPLGPPQRHVPGPPHLVSTNKHFVGEEGWVLDSAANRLIGEVVQSRRRPLLGPSPG